jgi:benzoate membrane transport protein
MSNHFPPPAAPHGLASLIQPVTAGVLAAFVGVASSFTILLAGFAAVGATSAEAASGLFAVTIVMGLLSIILSLRTRMPITIAWSTPGAALLISTAAPAGGYAAAVGAYLVAAVMIIAAGLWRPFGRAVGAIPAPLANAMLAGVLFQLCLAPVTAIGEMPALVLPIIVIWAAALRFARLYAVPLAVVATIVVVIVASPAPAGSLVGATWPHPLLIVPEFSFGAIISIALPLFIVTMASQNIPGLAVLNANGYRPKVAPLFIWTGAGSVVTAFFGGHTVNLAAITAALCAGPEAHPDASQRWIAPIAAGITNCGLALGAGYAVAFIAISPPILIQAVAGLALMGSLAGALANALDRERDRLPAVVTFAVTASGLTIFGIGAAFWGLAAGGALLALLSYRGRLS